MKKILGLFALIISFYAEAQEADEVFHTAYRSQGVSIGANSVGSIQNNVNLYSGDLSMPLNVLTMGTEIGIPISVNFSYNSNTDLSVLKWSKEQDDGILGHAWSFGYPKIVVDDRSTGTRIDDIFYLIEGGSNELICTDKSVIYVVDGMPGNWTAKTFKTKNYSPYTYYYIEDLERWEVWREGVKYVFGDETEFPTAVQWGAHWANWIGSSNNSSDIEKYGIIWNLAKVENQAGLWLEYSYLNREAQITTAGPETNTVSSLLESIVASSGEEVDFIYQTKPATEYYDPNTLASYQDRFTSDYLSSIEAYGKNGNLVQTVNLGYTFYTGQYAKRRLASVRSVNQYGHLSEPVVFEYHPSSARISSIKSPGGAITSFTYGSIAMNHLVQSLDRPTGYNQHKVWSMENYTVVAYRNSSNLSTKFYVYWWDGRWEQQELFDIDIWNSHVTENSFGLIELDELDIKFEKDHFAFSHIESASGGYSWFARAYIGTNGRWEGNIENLYTASRPQVVTGLNFAGMLRREGNYGIRIYTRSHDNNTWAMQYLSYGGMTTNGNHSATGTNNYILSHSNNGSALDEVQLFYLDEERHWNTNGAKKIPSTNSNDKSILYASESFAYLVITDDSYNDQSFKIISWDEDYNFPDNGFGYIYTDLSFSGYISDVKLYGNKLFYVQYYDNSSNLKKKVGRYNGATWNVEDKYVGSFGDDVFYLTGGQYSTYNPVSQSWTNITTDPQNAPNRFTVMLQNAMPRHYTIGFDGHQMVYHYRQSDGTYGTTGMTGPSGGNYDQYADGGYLSGHTNYFVNDGKLTFRRSGTYIQMPLVQTNSEWEENNIEQSYYGPGSFVTHSATASDDLVFNKLIQGFYGQSSPGVINVKPVTQITTYDGYNSISTQLEYDQTNKRLDNYGRAAFDKVTVTHGTGSGYTVHKFFNGTQTSGADFGNEDEYYAILKGLNYQVSAYNESDTEISYAKTGYEVLESNGYVVVTVPKTDTKQDNISLSTFYEYNEKFQRNESWFSNSDFSAPGITRTYKSQVKYIWENAPYNSGSIGLFGAVIQKKTTVTRIGQTFKVGASAVRWADWSGILAPEVSYQWNGATSLDFSEFNSTVNPAGWQKAGSITKRDALGRPTQVENIDGISSAAFYMFDYGSPHMTVSNAEDDEIFFDDFNDQALTDWFGSTMTESNGYLNLSSGSNNTYHTPIATGTVGSNVEFRMRFPNATSGTSAGYVFNKTSGGSAYNTGSNISLRINASTTGIQLSVYKGTTLLKSGTWNHPNEQKQWHQYQIRYFHHATNPWIDVYLDGELVVDNAYLGAINTGMTYRSFYNVSTPTQIDHYRVYPHDAFASSSSLDETTGLLEQTVDATGMMATFQYNSWGGLVTTVDGTSGLPVATAQGASSTKYYPAFANSDPGRSLSTVPSGDEGYADDFKELKPEWAVNAPDASKSTWSVIPGTGVLTNATTGSGLTSAGHGFFIDWGSEITGRVSFEFEVWANALYSDKQLGFAAGGNTWNYSSTGSELGVLSYFQGNDFKTDNGSVTTHLANVGYTMRHIRVKLTIDTETDETFVYVDGKQLAREPAKNSVTGIQKFGFLNYGTSGYGNTWYIDNFVMYVDGIESLVTFDATGKPLQSISRSFDDQLIVAENIYDAMGRTTASTKTTKVSGNLLAYRPGFVSSYDFSTGVTAGEVASINGESHITSNALFDDTPLGRVTTSGNPGASHNAFSTHASTFEYGANSLSSTSDFYMGSWALSPNIYSAQKTTSPDGWDQVSFYDIMGRLVMTKSDDVEITNQAGSSTTGKLTTQYVYNDQGRLSEIRPPNYFNNPGTGANTNWITLMYYDNLGRLVSKSSPDEGVISYVYDQAGRVIFSQNDKGAAEDFVHYFRYDALGRPTEQGYWNTTLPLSSMSSATVVPANLSTWRVKYTYEWPGRLVKKEVNNDENTDTEASESYTYDKYGRVTEVTQYTYDYNASAHIISYAYDRLGRVTSILYPDQGGTGQEAVTYHYHPDGSINSVGTQSDADRFASYSYDINGALSQEKLDNGSINRTFAYNAPGLLTSINDQWFGETLKYTTGGQNGFQSYAGLMSETAFAFKSAQWTGAAKPVDYSYKFDYDKRGRLKTANHTVNNNHDMGVGTPIKYDANGNFITVKKGPNTKNYTYNAGTNQVNSLDGQPGTEYFYDELGNITRSDNKDLDNIEYDQFMNLTTTIQRSVSGTYLTHLQYGPGGRVYKKDQVQNGTAYVETLYQRGLGSNPVVERYKDHTGANSIVKYIYGPTGLIATDDGTSYNFVLKDHLGSTRVVVADDGSVKSAYNYTPFGELITNTVGDDNSRKFTGQEYDKETGLHNLNARLYDAELGRFYANDPLSTLLSSWSGYHYAYNNPNTFTDRTGLCPGGTAWDTDCDGMADYPVYPDQNCANPDCSERNGVSAGGEWGPGDPTYDRYMAENEAWARNNGPSGGGYGNYLTPDGSFDHQAFYNNFVQGQNPYMNRGGSHIISHGYWESYSYVENSEIDWNLTGTTVLATVVVGRRYVETEGRSWYDHPHFLELEYQGPDVIGGEPNSWLMPGGLASKGVGILNSVKSLPAKAKVVAQMVKNSSLSDWIRKGPTIVSNQVVKGVGATGATTTWGIKGGGNLFKTGEPMGFHYHVHKYNWYTPWTWFKNTPIIKP